ncbi:hypothetical protein [uncultured Roseobacter sp.]|uniref:hypothetical protein n=1 Tax=uncultured Roseobacter sp. TaxID=114847 RepID=UPI00262B6FAC|nr:hypothetical protein [uncultured Roseobacter sp.]
MQKVDLHIHTKTSNQDRAFGFSEDRLKEYITNAGLDCIAVTNHNLFDKPQFEHIRGCVDVLVLPGIEVDVEKCQILVLSDGHNLDDFDQRCAEVSFKWNSTKSTLPYDDFTRIFGDLNQYILIPHYLKDPKISQDLLAKLASYITAGEVSSPKKFVSCIKDADKLVPVYFSDCRMSADLNPLPTRQTYLDCSEVSFGTLREVLRDKNKVALTEADGNKLFQIFPDGQSLSTGLNVVLGDRSSGKSHTLQRISDWFGEDNGKFVRQFDLVARNEAEDEKKFKDFLSERTSIFSKDYLADLQKVVEDVLDIDTVADLASVEDYVTSLLEYARETSKHDAFSKAKLYNEDALTKKNLDGLRQLIASTKHLLRNVEYREVIDKHLDTDALEALYVELMRVYCTQEEANAKKNWVNALVQDVKSKLQRKSSAPKIAELDLIKVELNKRKVSKFEEVVTLARQPKTPLRKRKQGFEVVAQVGPFRRAGELKEASRSNRSFSAAFQKYDEPYAFLQELRKIGDPVTAAELSKFLVKVDYKILNRDGLEASGGERSEFFLLDQIEGAEGAEVLLIDEPESSFDNNFLKEDVNELIKAMSHKMPVVIVTHNNTVGASIQPDYLICTRKELSDGEIKFRLYSGHPTSKKLTSTDGHELLTRDVLLGSLDAGVEAYEQRGITYENLKN